MDALKEAYYAQGIVSGSFLLQLDAPPSRRFSAARSSMTGDRERVVLAAFVASALLAGGNAVAIRFSNRELPPLWGAGLRFLFAAVLLVAIMAALKLAFPRGRALTGALLYGLFQFSGAFGLYYYALVRVHAGLGQTLLALVPLATLLLAVAQRQEHFRTAALVGTLLGLVGIGLISRDPLHKSVPLVSLLAVFGTAVLLVGGSALVGEPIVVPQRFATGVALGYVAAVGSVVVFLLYLFVLQQWTASRAAYIFVLIPFITVVLSAWLDDEPVGAGLVLGGLLVLTGVYVGALRPARASPTPAKAPTAR